MGLLYLSLLTLCQQCADGSLDVCKLELRVPDLSSVIAAHSSQITEVRPATFSLSLSPSHSVSLCLFLPYLPSIYRIPPFDQCQGHVAVGASVFGCVFVSAPLRLWTRYHVRCA